ncbi:hypothetical protein RJ639_041322 [Escallonia herrerae]|uniref:DUF659 domain-containing protein n=1 Tax=Escallonia herrerae TaxID=1293975 RepID=A0AA88WH73_9ASTE|nr:hypothetical protein RJ639_041322 [Escallonia herrerae]
MAKMGSWTAEPVMTTDDDSEDVVVSADSIGNAGKKKGKEVTVANKRKNVSNFFAPRTTLGSQPSIKSAMATKEMDANDEPFNGAHSKYYQPMFDDALAVGPGFKAPSFHDLRGNLLRTLVDEITTYLDEFRPIWELYGCSIMSDGWSNRRQEPVINFLIYCPKEFTNGKELCRPGITRFATNFLSLQCLLKFKKELRQKFTCDKWLNSKLAKTVAGKEAAKWVLEDRDFWLQCQHVVKLSEPLVRVLRLTDGDEKPSMGYLYEAIDKAKETIKSNLKNRLSLYMPVLRVIDARWDKQLSSPLHSAGCFLNLGIFFKPSFKKQKEVTRGLLSTITALVHDDYMQDLISSQLEEYKQATGDFGMAIAVRQREKLNPGYGRTKEALDPVSLDNIDVLADWVSEEESVITQEDLDNDVNLEDEEVHYEDEEDALHDIPSQYDWEFGGERDPYHYIE